MVEEIIAEGYLPEEVADLLVAQYGMSYGDASLAVDTALGLPGDVIVDDLDELIPDSLAAAARPDVSDLAMIAVYPRPEEQEALAVDGGNDAETMHVTLVFLGEAADVDEDLIAETLTDIGRVTAPLEGSIGGIGRFIAGEDGVPVIALPSVKGLAELRSLIAEALSQQGIESPTEHGWTPHLTIQYIDEKGGELPAVPDVPLHFDSITFSRGDRRRDFPLEG